LIRSRPPEAVAIHRQHPPRALCLKGRGVWRG